VSGFGRYQTIKSLTVMEDSKITQASNLNNLSNAIDDAHQSNITSNGNVFPINTFPHNFKELVIDLNKSLNYPYDYTATAILSAISTIVGTTAKVQVKNKWFEYGSLYCCLIGNAGANKTHPVSTIFSVIKDIDKINHDRYVNLYNLYNEYQKLPKKEKEETTSVFQPKLIKSILTNFTPEVLNKRLNENERGCTVVSDEMATFFEGMNNYSKGDQIGMYLSFWNNQPTTIDRIGEPIPLFINNPYLSIIGGLQPRTIAKAFPIQKLNNGFFQRFLFAFPDTTFKKSINDNELNEEVLDRFKNYINECYLSTEGLESDGTINSKVLNWTPEAKIFFYKWQNENCELVNDYSNNIKGEIISKFDNHFIRLALLLQLMEDAKSDYIQIKATEGAKELCDYYMNCSLKVLALIQDPMEYLDTLSDNRKRLYAKISDKFSTADAIATGEMFDIKERRIKEFLKDTILFKRIKHGFYEKNIKPKQN
jgi:hypothetical protein